MDFTQWMTYAVILILVDMLSNICFISKRDIGALFVHLFVLLVFKISVEPDDPAFFSIKYLFFFRR